MGDGIADMKMSNFVEGIESMVVVMMIVTGLDTANENIAKFIGGSNGVSIERCEACDPSRTGIVRNKVKLTILIQEKRNGLADIPNEEEIGIGKS